MYTPVVAAAKHCAPTAVFGEPVVLESKAFAPKAVFCEPVVFAVNA